MWVKQLFIAIKARDMAPATRLSIQIVCENESNLGNRPYVFMLPGGPGANHSHYKDYVCLHKSSNVVFIDPRGCGLSDKQDPFCYTMDNYIQDIEAIRQHLQLEKIILLGKSYGAMCALGYTLTYKERVSNLILAAGSPSFRNLETARQNLEKRGNPAQKEVCKKLWAGNFANDQEVDHFFDVMDGLYSWKVRHDLPVNRPPSDYLFAHEPLNQGFGGFLRTFDYENRLHEVTCKTLILVGKEDWITDKKHSQLMADRIPDNQFIVFPNADHSMESDVPEAFFSSIQSFLINHCQKKVAPATALLLTTLHESTTAQSSHLRGLSTPSTEVAFASGYQGTWLKTIDGGKHWIKGQIPGAEQQEFRDIKAFSADIAYIMSAGAGNASRVYKTMDGGKSWQLQLTGKNAEFFNCIAFWNSEHGMVLSDPVEGKFRVYITKNGGISWQTSSNMPMALDNEGAFAASGSCMTVYGELNAWFGTGVNTARVFYTKDGGNSWSVTTTPLMQSTASSGIFSIAFHDLQQGVIVGGDYKNPENGNANLAFTEDGGLTWKLADIAPQFYWSSVKYSPDGSHILVTGSKHTGLTTSKNPQQWKASCHTNGLEALSFWSKNKALVTGEQDLIVQCEISELNAGFVKR